MNDNEQVYNDKRIGVYGGQRPELSIAGNPASVNPAMVIQLGNNCYCVANAFEQNIDPEELQRLKTIVAVKPKQKVIDNGK